MIGRGAKLVIAVKVLPVVLVLALLALFVAAIVTEDDAEAQGLSGIACTTEPGGAQSVAGFGPDSVTIAAEIVAAGKEMGLPQRAWVIAVATGMVESSLRNLSHGDTAGPDSRGVFQQRDSWGPLSVRMNPRESAKLFYQRLVALTNPTWDQDTFSNAAQRVQISAFGWKYGEFEAKANQMVGAVEGIRCTSSGGLPPGVALPANPKAAIIVKAALEQVGVDYAWGGGNAAGPTRGTSDNGGAADAHKDYNKIGFDCSGLALFAYAKIGVAVPHQTQVMWDAFQPAITDRAKLQAGDLLMLGTHRSTRLVHHVGIYLGDGAVVEAPQSGMKVQVRQDIWAPDSNYADQFVGALRPGVV